MTIDNQTPMKVVSSANEPFLSWLSMHVYSSGRRSWIRQNRTRCSRTSKRGRFDHWWLNLFLQLWTQTIWMNLGDVKGTPDRLSNRCTSVGLSWTRLFDIQQNSCRRCFIILGRTRFRVCCEDDRPSQGFYIGFSTSEAQLSSHVMRFMKSLLFNPFKSTSNWHKRLFWQLISLAWN